MVADRTQLDQLAAQIPGGKPVLERARARAKQAVEIAGTALETDPTLRDHDRCRDLDVCVEILRQLKPLARQAALTLEHDRLAETGLPSGEPAWPRRINPDAPAELDALSERAVELAERLAVAALPDWNTPRRIRERSERLLPSGEFIASLAEQLAEAVRAAAELPCPAAAAVQLAALADQLRAAADRRPAH